MEHEKQSPLIELSEDLHQALDALEETLQGTYGMSQDAMAKVQEQRPALPLEDALDLLRDSLVKANARVNGLRDRLTASIRRIQRA